MAAPQKRSRATPLGAANHLRIRANRPVSTSLESHTAWRERAVWIVMRTSCNSGSWSVLDSASIGASGAPVNAPWRSPVRCARFDRASIAQCGAWAQGQSEWRFDRRRCPAYDGYRDPATATIKTSPRFLGGEPMTETTD